MRIDDLLNLLNGETAAVALFFIGLYGLIARRNIVKTVISLGVMETGVILFFIAANFRPGSLAPIGTGDPAAMADPLPQALMITAIVIGVSVTAVGLTMFITLYRQFGSTNWSKIGLKRKDRSHE